MTFINKSLSHYKIVSKIGAGGMATVYLADDLKHSRKVAIKVMNAGMPDPVSVDRFRREIEIAAGFTHPHILPLHDSGFVDEQPFYVMPHIEGETLRQRIARQNPLPLQDALRIATEIASALGYAHDRGLIHRDIKPGNVLLSGGIALVADFGIARFTGADQPTVLTADSSTMGTPAYMSPEQIEGKADIDGRADLYSLGCVLYEMLSGVTPFSGPTHSLAYQHISVQPRSIAELRPDLPPPMVETIMKALAKDKRARHSNAAEFAAGLASIYQPSASGRARPLPTNLPKERTSFIGRASDLAECAQLLQSTRMLVLTGLGGCGKTRLAVKLAENLTSDFPDGTFFVDLAPLTDGNRVLGGIATSLHVSEEAGKDLDVLLRNHISNKRMLVLLDNCEHLLSACGKAADGLLNSSADLCIIATSREALNVHGERVFSVRSLQVPELGFERFSDIESADAVKLFVDRAQIAQRGFQLRNENVSAVAEICRRLDGIPLALELAAARVKMLSIEQIRAKLSDRFKLLSGTSQTTVPRHQTLRATIEWSYEQLPAEEQRLLRVLSVFAGGWTLELATKVAGRTDEFEVLELLTRLVDKSFVVVDSDHHEQRRYTLLETVRQYVFERLNEMDQSLAVRTAHMEVFLALATRAHEERTTDEQKWSDALSIENDNLRAALEFARTLDAERFLTLAGSLAWFWILRTRLIEGHHYLTSALGLSQPQPPRPFRASTLWGVGHILALRGDAADSRLCIEEALRMWRELGDVHEIATKLDSIGWTQFLNGDDEAACATFEECLRLQRARGDANLINRAMVGLAQVLVALGRTQEAQPMAVEIINFSKARNDKRNEHFGWHFLADCALIQERCDESLELYRKSLALARDLGDRIEVGFEVQGVAMSLSGLGQSKKALRLAGAVKAQWGSLGADIHVVFWVKLLDKFIGKARQDAGMNEAKRAWNEGMAMPFDDAVALALAAEASVGS